MSKKKRQYAVRTPLTVKGGIRAQMATSGASRVWWSRRWMEMMEDFRIGARLGRGRNYAVSGQVSRLTFTDGQTEADVQGSSPHPYHCTIRLRQLTPEAADRIRSHLYRHPMLLGRLLAGELPFELETLFTENGTPFFPQRKEDVWSRCTCPDYANPCKHLAAVYFLLGETFVRKPSLLLTLRGLNLPELDFPIPAETPRKTEGTPPETLSATACYGAPHDPLPPDPLPIQNGPDVPLLARLGPLPFWRGQERFIDTLSHLYARAATRGQIIRTGDVLDLRREDEKVIITGGSLHLKGHKLRIDPNL